MFKNSLEDSWFGVLQNIVCHYPEILPKNEDGLLHKHIFFCFCITRIIFRKQILLFSYIPIYCNEMPTNRSSIFATAHSFYAARQVPLLLFINSYRKCLFIIKNTFLFNRKLKAMVSTQKEGAK